MSNLISLIFQKHFQIYGFQITQNVFVHLSCSNKTNSQIYVITHSSRGKYFPPFSSLVESVGDHERSAKSTIGFVIGFVYRFQYYKSKFLFSFFVFRFAMKIYWEYKFASSFMTLRASFSLASYTSNRFLRRSFASMMYFLCFTFQTNDKYIITFLHHHTCGLDFDCMVMSLLTSLTK